MLYFIGELLEVQTGEYNSLIFRSKQWDMGLKEFVPCSVSVGIADEVIQFLPTYKKLVGYVVKVPVLNIKTRKGGLFLLAQGRAELFSNESSETDLQDDVAIESDKNLATNLDLALEKDLDKPKEVKKNFLQEVLADDKTSS